MDHSATPTETEVDTVIEEFGGDHRAAIRALLHDIAVLAADYAGAVSTGYVRGRAVAEGVRRVQVKRTGDGVVPAVQPA